MYVRVFIVIAWTGYFASAQEKVCSSVCNTVGMLQSTPGRSCDDIYQNNKASRVRSGNYWINTTTGVHQMYCDMELECGGHKGGWMRIADLDTSRGDDCPPAWQLITTPGADARNMCRSGNSTGCYSASFTNYNISFHKICGQLRGYQKGNTNAFYDAPGRNINDPYMDGVSITLGNPRKHVWTYVVGLSDSGSDVANHWTYCPCANIRGSTPQAFIGDHYYCESGDVGDSNTDEYYTTDPLWDGLDCAASPDCCAHPDMPWFSRHFTTAQDTFIEVRICRDDPFTNEDVLIELVELYIQ